MMVSPDPRKTAFRITTDDDMTYLVLVDRNPNVDDICEAVGSLQHFLDLNNYTAEITTVIRCEEEGVYTHGVKLVKAIT